MSSVNPSPLDIVCGRLHPQNFSVNLSIAIDKNNESEMIGNHQFASAKNRGTLESKAVSKCQCQPHVRVTLFLSSSYRAPEGLALGEVLSNQENAPYIFFGGIVL